MGGSCASSSLLKSLPSGVIQFLVTVFFVKEKRVLATMLSLATLAFQALKRYAVSRVHCLLVALSHYVVQDNSSVKLWSISMNDTFSK